MLLLEVLLVMLLLEVLLVMLLLELLLLILALALELALVLVLALALELALVLTQQNLKVQRQRLRQIKRSSMISGRSILIMMALTVFTA
jgi:hypothetical protein